MSEANKAVVRRLVEEVVNRGDLRLLPTLVAADYVGHELIGNHYGPDGVRIDVSAYRAAFPDLEASLEDLLAGGDRVARRFTLRGRHLGPFLGIPATGRQVNVRGIGIDRLEAGKLAESWVNVDLLGLVRQLGAERIPGRDNGSW